MQKVVLLQTDIVDSTQLNARLGDEAHSAIRAEHDRVTRDLLSTWNGQELERTDGFLLRFETIADAVECAVAYHQAVGRFSVPLAARVGLHVGSLHFRQNIESHVLLGARDTEADGLSIALTVRIMSIAMGGQTLMSAEARAALGETARRVVGHGHWRLKGIDEPLELFEIGDDAAPFAPPPDVSKAFRVVFRHDHWLPRREVAHSIPAERNSFVGRKASLRELAARIAGDERLLTILGVGGTGKTRLAQHFGWAHLGDFPGGVWFCDLANARSVDGLCGAVAQGLGLALGQTDPVEQIGSAIAGRDACLVILDNFEQVVQFANRTVGRWLDRAIDAIFVVTSRSTLGIDGERVMPLAPLDAADGRELFAHRAQASGRDVLHSQTSAAQIGKLIELLDGLPLAIELAAARTRVLDVATLVARMRDRFRLLTSGEGRPSRQATLRTTFDWSWDLLNATDRTVLAQLSVFRGGFNLEGAEHVCRLHDDGNPLNAIDILQSLLEKSWVQRVSTSRFDMLKSIQDYAAERLGSDGVLLLAVEERHGAWYASLEAHVATDERCVEVDNLVAATKRAVDRGDAVIAVAALERSWFALKLRGPYRAAIDLAGEVLALPSLVSVDRAAAEFVMGDALQCCGAADEALVHFESGLALARACSARHQEARLLCGKGERLTDATRHDEARRTLDDAFVMAEQLGDETLQCAVLNALGNLRQNVGDAADAQRWYEKALKIAERLAHRRWEGGIFGNLGGMHHLQGHVALAQRYYDLAIQRAEELGDNRWENNARCNLGLLLGESGDLVNARLELERASTNAREIGHSRLECVAACNLGLICDKAGDTAAARNYFERALTLAAEVRDIRTEGQTRGHFGHLLARIGEPVEAARHFDRGEAILVDIEDDLSLGELLCQRAEADALLDADEATRTNLDRASSIADRIVAGKDSPLRRSIERLETHLVLKKGGQSR